MSNNKQGRSFEMLISVMKRLKIQNAQIRSPEYVKDIDTGTRREVDVGIRRKTDEGEIFIAVECRDRGSIQDIIWIEQLIAKKRSIQADLMIAVTSSAFTEPARLKASVHGVQLRHVDHFDPNEVLAWTEETYVEIGYVCVTELHQLGILCARPELVSKPLDQYEFQLADHDTPVDFGKFLWVMLDDRVLLQARDELAKPIANARIRAKLEPTRTISICTNPLTTITDLTVEVTVKRVVDRYPVSKAYKYQDSLRLETLALGYEYSVTGSEAVRLLVEPGTNNGILEIEWNKLKSLPQCYKDIISEIVLKCPYPVVLKGMSFRK